MHMDLEILEVMIKDELLSFDFEIEVVSKVA